MTNIKFDNYDYQKKNINFLKMFFLSGLECPRGAIYICAPPCQPTCKRPKVNPECFMKECKPGCYCPQPLVLHKKSCIHPDTCPKRRKRHRKS